MENLIKVEIKLICQPSEDEDDRVDVNTDAELSETNFQNLTTLLKSMGAAYECLKVGPVRPLVITAYDFKEAERLNDAIQGFLKNSKPVEEKDEVRVLVNIYYKPYSNDGSCAKYFDEKLPVDDFNKIVAFLKDCALVESNVDVSNFIFSKMITITCSDEANALKIMRGLHGCVKKSSEPVSKVDDTLVNEEDSTPKNNSISSEIDYIAKNLDDSDLFLQLAEEAAELSQACLKYVRAYRGNNPTKDSAEVYLKNIIEELTDVHVCTYVLNIETDIDTFLNKIHRWADRIRSKNAGEKK